MFIVTYKENKGFELLDFPFEHDFISPIKDVVEKAFFIDNETQRNAAKEIRKKSHSLHDGNVIKNEAQETVAVGREVEWSFDSENKFLGFQFKV